MYHGANYFYFKDSIHVGESHNLEFNFEDTDDIPDLQDFLNQICNQVIRSSFFQHEPKDVVNLLKLPIIMPSSLVGKMVNTDCDKKSLFNKELNYTTDVLGKLVAEKKLDVLNIDKLEGKHLKQVAKEIGLATSKKSDIFLQEEVKSLARLFLAGQGNLYRNDLFRGMMFL